MPKRAVLCQISSLDAQMHACTHIFAKIIHEDAALKTFADSDTWTFAFTQHLSRIAEASSSYNRTERFSALMLPEVLATCVECLQIACLRTVTSRLHDKFESFTPSPTPETGFSLFVVFCWQRP